MDDTARVYNCARCHRQVVICSHCDRGNIYCGPACAETARRSSQRAAGRRYQHTRRGRLRHAERQRRYRARRKKVTHHGSASPSPGDPLQSRSQTPAVLGESAHIIRCHFCQRICSPFLRVDYLHRSARGGRRERVPIHGLPGSLGIPP